MSRRRNEPKVKSIWSPVDLLQIMSKKHASKIWFYLLQHPEINDLNNLDELYSKWSISPTIQAIIQEDFNMGSTKVASRFDSARGDTIKLVIELFDGHKVETVIMKHFKRTTVCLSSQVGCQMGCRFCATGTMGIIGDLHAHEIIEQLVTANRISPVRNVVMMGMGEPLNNYDNLRSAIEFFIDPERFKLSPRHVTVSTVGVIKNMYRLAEDLPHVNLALSLHAPNQTLRQKIIPTAGGSPIYALMKAVANHIDKNCRKKSHALEVDDVKNLSTLTVAIDDDFDESKEFLDSNGKRPAKSKYGYHGVMIEYILLAGLNDQEEHARELGALLAPFGDYVLLNLIPYNPTDVRETFVAPTREASEAFQRVCQSEPYLIHTRIRVEMGQDIAGACGQLVLKAKEVNKKNNDRSSDHIEIEDIAKSKIGNQKPSQSNVDTSDHKDESKKENNEAKPPSDHNAVLVSFTVAVALIGSFLLLRRLKLS